MQIKRLVDPINDPAFVHFWFRSVKESHLHEFGAPPSIGSMQDELRHFAEDPKSVIFVAVDGTSIIGTIMGSVAKFPFTDFLVANEVFIRVDDKGKGVGRQLVDSFTEWGLSMGCKAVCLGVNQFTGADPDGACRAIEKMGFKPFNRNFYRGI